MTEYLTFDREEIWNDLLLRARESGVVGQEAFHELVDGYFQDLIDVGELDKDQDIHELTQEVKGRWQDFKVELGVDESPKEEG